MSESSSISSSPSRQQHNELCSFMFILVVNSMHLYTDFYSIAVQEAQSNV